MRFNTFDQVVSWYERTKPLVSKNHKLTYDVRPIGDRNRKWERIKKIDEHTYALLDGNYGNCIWGAPPGETDEYENLMAPIVWMRREDGDFIRIRNHNKWGMSVTRYNFLIYNLPSHLHFMYNQQGKHWIRHLGEDIPLPKSDMKLDYATKKIVNADDEKYLMFRVNTDGTITRVGPKIPMEVSRIDKDLKKEWNARVDAFYNYCAAVAPMIDVSWSSMNEYRKQLAEWVETTVGNKTWIYNAASVPVELARAVVTDDQHQMRVAFAALTIHNIGGRRIIESKDDVRRIKAAYNRLMNKALGFYKIERV